MLRNKQIIVVDNFYQTPDEVRKYALSADYYDPDCGGYQNPSQAWTTDGRYQPFDGWLASTRPNRYLTDENLKKLAAIIKQDIDMKHWNDGSFWNGSFQVKTNTSQIAIHSHGMSNPFNACWPGGWTGIVFLTPDAPLETGVSIWKHKTLSLDDPEWFLDRHINNWHKVKEVDNVHNRLVLMPADAYHSGTCGWGDSPPNARLIQTFFFQPTECNLPAEDAERFYRDISHRLDLLDKSQVVVFSNGRFTSQR